MGLKTIGAFVKGAFGSSKLDGQKVFDTVAKGVDNLKFTNEERSEVNLSIIEGVSSFVKDSLSESTDRSKSRREISFMIVKTFILVLGLIIGLICFDEPEKAKSVYEIVTGLQFHTAFMMVMAFFFGAHLIRAIPFRSNKKAEKGK